MQRARSFQLVLLFLSLAVTLPSAVAQVTFATVPAGNSPYAVAVNAGTNQIYVANNCGNDVNCQSLGTVTAINGVNNNTATVSVGAFPYLLAVDSATNEIYVPNYYGNDLTGASAGTVTVINGATNNTVPVAVGDNPYAVAVNPTTDTIYVGNYTDGTVSAIAGDTALQFVNVTPCRLVDTRLQFGGIGPILGGTYDTFNLPQAAQQSMGCPMLNLSSAAAY